MDSRSRFLPPRACDVVTDLESGSPLSDWGPSPVAVRQANPAGKAKGRARGNGAILVPEPANQVSRKAASLSARGPYRERTHVAKESILR